MLRFLIAAALLACPALASEAWFGGLAPGFKRPVAAAYFVQDEFNGTSGDTLVGGSNHDGEIGADWTANGDTTSAQGTVASTGDRVWVVSGALYASGVPADADYSAEVSLFVRTQVTGTHRDGVGVRWETAAGTGYTCEWVGDGVSTGTGNVNIFEYTTGTPSAGMGINYPLTLALSSSHTLKIRISGSNIACDVDGVERVTATDGTITAAGRVVIRHGGTASSDTQRNHFEYVRATN